MERISNNVLNCPNCGAPITGTKCEYCGTIFYDFANISTDGTPSYVRLKLLDRLIIFKAVTTDVRFEVQSNNEAILYENNNPYYVIDCPAYHVTMEMDLVPDDRGVIFEKRIKQ